MRFERHTTPISSIHVKDVAPRQEFITENGTTLGIALEPQLSDAELEHRQVCWLLPPPGKSAGDVMSIPASTPVRLVNVVLYWEPKQGGEA